MRTQFLFSARGERPWRLRPMRSPVVEKLRAALGKTSTAGVFDSAQKRLLYTIIVRRSAQMTILWRVGDGKCAQDDVFCGESEMQTTSVFSDLYLCQTS